MSLSSAGKKPRLPLAGIAVAVLACGAMALGGWLAYDRLGRTPPAPPAAGSVPLTGEELAVVRRLFANERDWRKRVIDPTKTPIAHQAARELFESLCVEKAPPVSWQIRHPDGLLTGVTYPARLEAAIDSTLRRLEGTKP